MNRYIKRFSGNDMWEKKFSIFYLISSEYLGLQKSTEFQCWIWIGQSLGHFYLFFNSHSFIHSFIRKKGKRGRETRIASIGLISKWLCWNDLGVGRNQSKNWKLRVGIPQGQTEAHTTSVLINSSHSLQHRKPGLWTRRDLNSGTLACELGLCVFVI